MDENYLIARMRASLTMARNAADAVARLVHFELAGRYGMAAARYAIDNPASLSEPVGVGVSSFRGSLNG